MTALPADLPVVDHHCHLSPAGEGVRAVQRFRAAGGTHLFLATQNYGEGVPATLEAYRDQFETTVRLGEQVRSATGVVVYPVLAPYPVDLLDLVPRLGFRGAVDLHVAALDLAGTFVRERRAVAIGEVGRIHFEAPQDVVRAQVEVLQHTWAAARDADCPAIIHSADLDPTEYRALADEARAAGLPSHRVVKHYARVRRTAEELGGVVPSYLARRELVREVRADPPPWFLETDYLDDPRRPGAVLDLATVPRRATAFAEEGPAAVERLRVPFERSVEVVYGWRPEVPGGANR